MAQRVENQTRRKPLYIPWTVGFCLFLAIAVFFLWEEHNAHILGAVPYVLLLLCPITHLLMHRGHRGHGGVLPGEESQTAHRHEGGTP